MIEQLKMRTIEHAKHKSYGYSLIKEEGGSVLRLLNILLFLCF